MKALVIQHDHVSPLGPIGEQLTARGYDLQTCGVVPSDRFDEPNVEWKAPSMLDFDLVVLMGSPWAVYDHDRIGAWVKTELDELRRADLAGQPELGICLGGQALAADHGGTVVQAPEPELGWTRFHGDGDLIPDGPWFELHFDRWTPPPGATQLAQTARAPQAFLLRRNLAVQFHPELTSASLQDWLDAGAATLFENRGIRVASLVDETRKNEADARVRAHRLIDGFVDRVANGPAL
jgi:GMP synthase-like glutamine amidotransferase